MPILRVLFTTMRGRTRVRALAAVAAAGAACASSALAAAPTSHGHDPRRRTVAARCTTKRGRKGTAHHTCRKATRVPARGTARGGGRLEATPVGLGGTPEPPFAPVPKPPSAPVAPSAPAPAPPVAGGSPHPAEPWAPGNITTDPIDPRYLNEVPFGTTSFWIEPWRAYLDTWPASRLLESVGVNFNVSAKLAEPVAQLLQESGFKEARVGINWHSLSYSEPGVFWNEAEKLERLIALKRHGLRPLIVLDANSSAPAPSRPVTLTTLAAAPAGATTVQLAAESAAAVLPGKTGFNGLVFAGAPDLLITAVAPSGVATLSKPLPAALPAGPHKGTTLLYAPFERPTLANGASNPRFQESLAGWLQYVAAVMRLASKAVGPGGYDIEVWNELSFGSQFLNAEHYYTHGSSFEEACPEVISPEEGTIEDCESEAPRQVVEKGTVTKEVTRILLEETVAYIRNPANGATPAVGITNGFASETPFPSGANAPVGLTALSKHPYAIGKEYPAAYPVNNIKPLNALGQGDRISKSDPAPQFIPNEEALFPEFRLSALATETLTRDLAPWTTEIYGFPHGREIGPIGGPPVQKWVTEYNLGFKKTIVPRGPNGVTPVPGAVVTPADHIHFEAKALLRSLVSFVNKGVTRMYFFAAANAGQMSMISEAFTAAAAAGPAYPGQALGGEVMEGFRSLLSQFQGPGLGSSPATQLSLLSIAQEGTHAQFTGDGTEAHPSLYDREVLAVLPFQTSPRSFAIPVYVMTHDLLTLYEPAAPVTDIHRFDLPDEHFKITLGNLPVTSSPPTVSFYDPLRREDAPARLLSREGSKETFEVAATDYPRILELSYP